MPDPTRYQRLKERKLVQWALAYLAGAWVALEAIGFLADQFNWPGIILQALTILALVGLPVVLVLAWYHGEQGRQRASGAELLMIALLFLIAGGVLSVLPRRGGGSVAADVNVSEPEVAERPSIAVLPLDNISPNPDDEYFAEGMHEQLVSTLSRVSGISVRGRTSVMRYRDDLKTLPEIAEEIGVGFILEGSARMAGQQVVVTVQLMDARRDEHLWSGEYDREFSVANVVHLQREIAEQVVEAIGAALTSEDRLRISAAPTENTEAFTLYLRAGQYFWHRRTEDGLFRAIQLFEDAIGLDESFAPAFAGLADAYALLPFYGDQLSPRDARVRANSAAARAIELDHQTGEAYASLGFIKYFYDWDVDAAEAAYERAVELSPEYATANQWYGNFLSRTGRHEEGITRLRLALSLDPLSEVIHRNLGIALDRAGRYDEAEAEYRRTLALYPDSPGSLRDLGWLLVYRGEYEAALQLRPSVAHIAAYMALNRREEARELAATYADESLLTRAGVAVALGDIDRAFELLDQAYQRRDPGLLGVGDSGSFRPLRQDPRLLELRQRMGMITWF